MKIPKACPHCNKGKGKRILAWYNGVYGEWHENCLAAFKKAAIEQTFSPRKSGRK